MKSKISVLILTILLFFSCSKSSQEVHKLEFVTIKLEENQSFMKGKELYYEPSNDTIINASNVNIKEIISVIETFYQSENNMEKVLFKNPKNLKINLMVVKNDLSISRREAFNELITFLKRKQLVDF